jgi:hypothetical protein
MIYTQILPVESTVNLNIRLMSGQEVSKVSRMFARMTLALPVETLRGTR